MCIRDSLSPSLAQISNTAYVRLPLCVVRSIDAKQVSISSVPVSYTHLDVYKRQNEDSRMAELAAYLEEHLSGFQQYDDGIVRQLVERITVVDAETIRIKFRYSDVEIEQAMC